MRRVDAAPERDSYIRAAADLEDTMVTAFVLETLTARARNVVKDRQSLVLSNKAFDEFLDKLDKPAQPMPEMVELFRRRPKTVEG